MFYGSSHSSHKILTNWLINVDNFVQRTIHFNKHRICKHICKYIFISLIYRLGGGGHGAFAMFLGGLTLLKFGKLCSTPNSPSFPNHSGSSYYPLNDS